ncbi:MAG: porin [Sulfuriferula sp.]
MNKKLIALVVAGACAAPLTASAANDGVVLFGRIQAEYASIDINRAPAAAGNYTQRSINDNGVMSRWGLKINEDLGNGLAAIGQVEFLLNPPNGSTEGAREQWVGLSSRSLGSVKIGRNQAPMKTIGGAAYDIFVATDLQARGSGGAMWAPSTGFGASGFVNQSVKYESPNMGGFSLAVLAAPNNASSGLGNTAATNGHGNGVDWNAGAKYDFGMGEVIAGYSRDTANDLQKAALTNGAYGSDETAWRLGGKVKLADLTLLGQYEKISSALGSAGSLGALSTTGCSSGSAAAGAGGTAGGLAGTAQCNTALNANGDGKIWFLGAHYKIGNTILVLQGGKTSADAIGTASSKEAKNITVGAVYMLSKRTRVYGGYQRVNVSLNTVGATDPDRKTWAVGMRTDF